LTEKLDFNFSQKNDLHWMAKSDSLFCVETTWWAVHQCEQLRSEASLIPGMKAELESLRQRHTSALELMGERDEEVMSFLSEMLIHGEPIINIFFLCILLLSSSLLNETVERSILSYDSLR
jgi:hypothetical protein